MLPYSHISRMGKTMSKRGPGKSFRKGLTLLEVADMFRDEATAQRWIELQRWPHGPCCPECGSLNVQSGIKHRTMSHRCRDCPEKTFFSLRKGTIMEGSKLSYRVWAIGIYLFMTNIKGISSMRLHRELGISQKAAWFMLHRLRKAMETGGTGGFAGPVEADETYMGGKRKNMSNAKRKALAEAGMGRGPSGKAIVAGMKDRDTNQVVAKVVASADKPTLHGFLGEHLDPSATLYTDEALVYQKVPYAHETVNHSVSQYVSGMAHINGLESHWALLKRGFHGVYHKMSPKHLDRYVQEFATRHNIRNADTIDQMRIIVESMARKRLRYRDLIRDNGLPSGARSE